MNSRLFSAAAAHRYWRIKLTNTPGGGPWCSELHFIEKGSGSFRPWIMPPVMLDSGNERAVLTIADSGNIRRARALDDAKYAFISATNDGLAADRSSKLLGQGRTLLQTLIYEIPNG